MDGYQYNLDRFLSDRRKHMFDDNVLNDLNLRYLSAAKELAIADLQMAQLKLGLSEFLLKIITSSSFQQLEHMAKQDLIYFKFLPNEKLFSCLLEHPNDEVVRLSLLVSSNHC